MLLDAGLPGMGGHEVLAAMRARPAGRRVPVLFVTGAGEIEDRVRGLEAGADDYVVKPVDVDELVARVGAQLRQQATWQALTDELERRLDTVLMLRRVRRAETAEATARQVCAELVGFPSIDGAAILTVRTSGEVVPIAVSGALTARFRAGEPLAPHVAHPFLARLRRGPWADSGDPSEGSALVDIGGLAVAPLLGNRGPIGAIVLSGPQDPRRSGALLSAAIDFSVVVGALINPELERQEALDDARAALRAIVADRGFWSVSSRSSISSGAMSWATRG